MASYTIECAVDDSYFTGAGSEDSGFTYETFGDIFWDVIYTDAKLWQFSFYLEIAHNILSVEYDEPNIQYRITGNRVDFFADFNPAGFTGSLQVNIYAGDPPPVEPEYKTIPINNWVGVLKGGDFDPSIGENTNYPTGEFSPFENAILKYPDGGLIEFDGSSFKLDINRKTNGDNIIQVFPNDGYSLVGAGLRLKHDPISDLSYWVDNPPTDGNYTPSEIVIDDGFISLKLTPEFASVLVQVDGDGSGGGSGVAGGAYSNNYLLTKKQYNDLRGETFSIIQSGEGGSIEVITFDQWIDNVRLYPFPLLPDDIGLPTKIIAGTYQLETEGLSLKSDVIRLDFGSFDVKGSYGNSLDFRGVECSLVLPFIDGVIDLNIYDIIDKKIKVICYVVVGDGLTTINIYSDGVLISNNTTTIGRSIPLMSVEKAQSTSITISGSINDLKRAFIRVEKPVYSGIVLVEVLEDVSQVGNYFRYVSGVVNSECNYDEYSELINILKDGVYKND